MNKREELSASTRKPPPMRPSTIFAIFSVFHSYFQQCKLIAEKNTENLFKSQPVIRIDTTRRYVSRNVNLKI